MIKSPSHPQIPPGYGGRIHSPHPHDVLSGSGSRFNSHPGNVHYLDIVHSYKQEYLTKKVEKACIAARIVANVRSLEPNGRFLKEEYPGCFLEIGDERALERAATALRTALRSNSSRGTGRGQSRKVKQRKQQSHQADPPRQPHHPNPPPTTDVDAQIVIECPMQPAFIARSRGEKRMKIADNRASQHVYAHKYLAKFNALSEEDRALLEELNSYYDGELHDVKAGFRDTVIYCLGQRDFEACDLYWYLRLFNEQCSLIPFIGSSGDDILLQKLRGFIQRAKNTDYISTMRKKHLIVHRSTEDAMDMTARFFECLGTEREDSKKRAEEAFVKLADMVCYDTDDDDDDDDEWY